MIDNQRVEELAKKVREGVVRIDLENVRLRSPQGVEEAAPYPFFVAIEKDCLVCHWRVPLGEKLAPIMASLVERRHNRVTTEADNYGISAVTFDGLSIELEELSPAPSWTSRFGGPTNYSTDFQTIKLPAMGDETQTFDQILERLNRLTKQPDHGAPVANPREKKERLFAIVPGVELRIKNSGVETSSTHPLLGKSGQSRGNCLIGEVYGGKFCVEAREKDLWVYYERTMSNPMMAPTAVKVFEGLLSAIGFTQGCHPWPFYREHVRDHVVVERWLRCCPDCAREALLPIEDRRLLYSENARDLFVKACSFFATDSEDSKLLTRALWLMRASHRDSMPLEIRLITLCSVLEGIIHQRAKTLLTNEERTPTKPRKEKWQLIVTRLNLPWEAFEPAFHSWEFYRHALAHGFQERSDETPDTAFDAYSRITAAIYIFMAKAMGFAGEMESSLLEGKRVSLGKSNVEQ